MRMKQELRRKRTMQKLLEAAKALIREKGCDAVTTQDLMDRSGLSKGAIFHYVKSKDELFSWVLKERVEHIDERFNREVNRGKKQFQGPTQQIAAEFSALEDPEDVANKVFIYLLGKIGDPAIDEVILHYYERTLELSKEWIVTGQRHGVIPDTVDAEKTAELFLLISMGMRVRSAIPVGSSFNAEDFSTLMETLLQNS